MCWGFDPGDGWFEIIWQLSLAIEAELNYSWMRNARTSSRNTCPAGGGECRNTRFAQMRDRVAVSSAITPRLLSLKAAAYLFSTTWSVEELIRTGKLRTTTIANSRLIDIHDLDAWVDGQTGSADTRKGNSSEPTPRQGKRRWRS
jgi:hypothetical protein